MRSTPPTRLPADVYETAAEEAKAAGRTVPQQIAHWARIGRALEISPTVNHRAVRQVLAGDGSYDLLGEREQAQVRAAWGERIKALREGLDFEAEFASRSESYSEADQAGRVVVHEGRHAS